MRNLMLILVVFALGACATAPEALPNVPATVRVAVREPMDIPSWATSELPMPEPQDGTVEARATSHNTRGLVIELANCHRRLLKKLSDGLDVDERECNPAEALW